MVRNIKTLDNEMINNIRTMTEEEKMNLLALNEVVESIKPFVDLA